MVEGLGLVARCCRPVAPNRSNQFDDVMSRSDGERSCDGVQDRERKEKRSEWKSWECCKREVLGKEKRRAVRTSHACDFFYIQLRVPSPPFGVGVAVPACPDLSRV